MIQGPKKIRGRTYPGAERPRHMRGTPMCGPHFGHRDAPRVLQLQFVVVAGLFRGYLSKSGRLLATNRHDLGWLLPQCTKHPLLWAIVPALLGFSLPRVSHFTEFHTARSVICVTLQDY